MTTKKIPLIEVCVEGIDGLLAAQAAGADRVELCASLIEGGITPSLGTVREALELATIPFHVIVRPRGGDFLYSRRRVRLDGRRCRGAARPRRGRRRGRLPHRGRHHRRDAHARAGRGRRPARTSPATAPST